MTSSFKNFLSPFEEMVAYETLWGAQDESLRTIANRFKKEKVLPTELLRREQDLIDIEKIEQKVRSFLKHKSGFSVSVHGGFQYPNKLQEAKYPIELFYYKGDIGLLDSRCVSVVGARKCSEDGKKRAAKLAADLVRNEVTIVSGLAVGIDTAALQSAIEHKGKVVGVIGTPIDEYYPSENRELQNKIADNHLLISQVPFYRYATEPFKAKRNYFPQRNETMSALSEATIIVEASDTSGSLTQARACLEQGRKLFILNSCFERSDISWPAKFEKRGAHRVDSTGEILFALGLA